MLVNESMLDIMLIRVSLFSLDNNYQAGGDMATLLKGRYQLVENLRSGGMGTVFRAVDTITNKEVAVKEKFCENSITIIS
jgi:hypothetical protein